MARILVVDDSPTDLHVFKKFLEDKQHSVLVATNGEEGFSKAKSEQPDLILMDIIMPGLNGYETTRKIAQDPTTSKIPVLMVSSKNQPVDRIWGMRQGAHEYVGKPINKNELANKIDMLLGIV